MRTEALKIQNKDGSLPAHLAIKRGHFTLAAILLTEQWTADYLESKNIPHFAASAGWVDGVKQCINAGVNINAPQTTGGPRMLTLAICGLLVKQFDSPEQQSIVSLLLAQPNIKDSINKIDGTHTHTPLASAVTHNCPHIAALLVAHKDINLDEKFAGKTIREVAQVKAQTTPAWKKVIEALDARAQLSAEGINDTRDQTIASLTKQLEQQQRQIQEQEKQLQQKDVTIAKLATSLATITALVGTPASTSAAVIANTAPPVTSAATTVTLFSAQTSANSGVTRKRSVSFP